MKLPLDRLRHLKGKAADSAGGAPEGKKKKRRKLKKPVVIAAAAVVLLGGAAISSLLTTRSAISFLVFTLLYTPCVAAIATIRRELDSRLKTVGVVLLQCTVAWIVACAAYAIAGLV